MNDRNIVASCSARPLFEPIAIGDLSLHNRVPVRKTLDLYDRIKGIAVPVPQVKWRLILF